MSGRSSVLFVDIGNSRIKCCYQGNLNDVFILEDAKKVTALLQQVTHCVVAAVGQQQQLDILCQILDEFHITSQLLTTTKEQFGIKCAYEQPAKMGIDRWLAILACQQEYKGGFAVLDLGTAMTCDFVDSNGQHLGGWIAPGMTIMKNALQQRTEKVMTNAQNQHPVLLQIGQNTADCVDYGCLAAVQGFLHSAKLIVSRFSPQVKIFVAGGDANLLEQLTDEQIEIIVNPVLKGIDRVISG
ncbi:type III pantothenate kinase [Neptunicella sp. SCSIO 80796]|uniref:type III pantothenate kinase n=1 Tax=Neptunicella plasticusilytica TaxID=3117012 RepID=UPI003A4D6D97